MTIKYVIEVVAALTALAGLVGLLIHRIKANKSIGARAVQFAVAVLLIPTVLILGLEKAMTDATLGTLLERYCRVCPVARRGVSAEPGRQRRIGFRGG